MEIKVSDDSVYIKSCGETRVCTFDELVGMFKNSDERGRRRLAVNFFDTSLFRTVDICKTNNRKPGSPEVLECVLKTCKSFDNYGIESEIDEIVGCDPYTPLY